MLHSATPIPFLLHLSCFLFTGAPVCDAEAGPAWHCYVLHPAAINPLHFCICAVIFSQVREYVTRELAQRLRPELEAAVKTNDSSEW